MGDLAGLSRAVTAIVSTIATRQQCRPIRKFAEGDTPVRRQSSSSADRRDGTAGAGERHHLVHEMQAQIQMFVAYRTAMLAAISHDLRTTFDPIAWRRTDRGTRRSRHGCSAMSTVAGDGRWRARLLPRRTPTRRQWTSFDLPGVLQTMPTTMPIRTSRSAMQDPRTRSIGPAIRTETRLCQTWSRTPSNMARPRPSTCLPGKDHHGHGERSGPGIQLRPAARVQSLLPARKLTQSG